MTVPGPLFSKATRAGPPCTVEQIAALAAATDQTAEAGKMLIGSSISCFSCVSTCASKLGQARKDCAVKCSQDTYLAPAVLATCEEATMRTSLAHFLASCGARRADPPPPLSYAYQ